MKSLFSRWRRLWAVAPGLLAFAVMVVLGHSSLGRELEQLEYRLLFQLRRPLAWDSRLVVVAIDDASVAQLGRFPWPRSRYVDLLAQLQEARPNVVVFDLLFPDPSPDDPAFAEAIQNYGSVVLATAWDEQGQPLLPPSELQAAALAIGHIYQLRDSDGAMRTVLPQANGETALGIVAVQAFSLTQAPVPLPSNDRPLWLNWPTSVRQLKTVAIADVLVGQIDPDIFRQKIVLVGVTATGVDAQTTPYDTERPASGLHVHATLIDNLLDQRLLHPLAGTGLQGGLLVLTLAIGLGLFGRPLRIQGLWIALIMAGWGILAIALFNITIWLPLLQPLMLFGLTALLGGLSQHWLVHHQLERQIRYLWQTYRADVITPPLITALGKSGERASPLVQLTALAEQLGRSQATQAAIARSIPLGLLAADWQGRIWFCNPLMIDWLAIQVGDNLAAALVPNWLSATAWEDYWASLQQGVAINPVEIQRTNRWFEMRLEPLQDQANHRLPALGGLLLLAEITYRKQIEADLRTLNQTLEQQVQQRTWQLAQANQELATEITHRRQAQDKLAYDAFHDALTGLPNRPHFLRYLHERLSAEYPTPFAVLFLDCDRFKLVNDSFGHWVGDELLQAVAQLLRECVRPEDIVARFGGDEFTILLTQIETQDEVIAVARRIRQRFAAPFRIQHHQFFIGISIGIVTSSAGHQHPEDILRDADTAMYQAKVNGLGYALFEPGMHMQVRRSLELEVDLRQALELHQFQLHYQPILSLSQQQLLGWEVLLRWQPSDRDLVYPSDFIDVAEDTGLIVPIGYWVLQEACQQLRRWQQSRLASEDVVICINLSVKQFTQPDLISQIEAILEQTALASRSLKLEITESVLMVDGEWAVRVFNQLRAMGIRLSIDDFGTGYSSLSYLQRFPLDTLKIDRSFITDIHQDSKQFGIVEAIARLAHHLDMQVIAEGIESDSQVVSLVQLGCQFGQGYWFSRPLNQDQMTQFLRRRLSE